MFAFAAANCSIVTSAAIEGMYRIPLVLAPRSKPSSFSGIVGPTSSSGAAAGLIKKGAEKLLPRIVVLLHY